MRAVLASIVFVTACNGGGGGNRAPVISGASLTTDEDTAVSGALDATDPDGDALTASVTTQPSHGTLTSGAGLTFVYTPALNYHGADSFVITVSDGRADASGTVNVTVSAIEDCGDAEDGPNEPCDDGNADETDGCTSQCVSGVVCNAAAFAGGDAFAVDARNGRCFVSYDGEQTTFGAAQTACTGGGGHLATITDVIEDGVVTNVVNATENPWIGASEDGNDTDAVFTWVTGEAWGYARFAPMQPDDDAGAGGNGECLHVDPVAGGWNDTNCDFTGFVTGRICEYD